MAVVLAALAAAGTPAAASVEDVPVDQPLAVLLEDQVARAEPSLEARGVQTVHGRRPLTRVRTVLPVLGSATSSAGREWLHVRLPGRPNSHTGWILAEATRRESTPWSIHLQLSSRVVTVYQYGRAVRRFRAVIGTRSTPTPQGRFFVEEAVALAPGAAGGPYALALSARSAVLQEFAGGPGQTALHGTRGLYGRRGTAASHGCVRLGTRAIRWLARRITAGVPLHVER